LRHIPGDFLKSLLLSLLAVSTSLGQGTTGAAVDLSGVVVPNAAFPALHTSKGTTSAAQPLEEGSF
jgi:hypothetical protein